MLAFSYLLALLPLILLGGVCTFFAVLLLRNRVVTLVISVKRVQPRSSNVQEV